MTLDITVGPQSERATGETFDFKEAFSIKDKRLTSLSLIVVFY